VSRALSGRNHGRTSPNAEDVDDPLG
jgi:hypothetical protein